MRNPTSGTILVAVAFATLWDGCDGVRLLVSKNLAAAAVLEPLPDPTVNMKKVALGQRLFFDTRLSGDGTVSCASCHSFDHGGAEPRATSLGIGGAIGPINAPTGAQCVAQLRAVLGRTGEGST